jgi:hypothetical protein
MLVRPQEGTNVEFEGSTLRWGFDCCHCGWVFRVRLSGAASKAIDNTSLGAFGDAHLAAVRRSNILLRLSKHSQQIRLPEDWHQSNAELQRRARSRQSHVLLRCNRSGRQRRKQILY